MLIAFLNISKFYDRFKIIFATFTATLILSLPNLRFVKKFAKSRKSLWTSYIQPTCRTEATTTISLYISKPRGCESNFTTVVSAYAFVAISTDLKVSSMPAV